MPPIPRIPETALESLCQIVGDTNEGLKGREIGALLRSCGIDDPAPGITKRDRLYAALSQKQQVDGCANNVLAFIKQAMSPVRYHRDRDTFERRRGELNRVLAFCGFTLRENGEIARVDVARTLTEAEARATDLRTELLRRSVHPDVLRFCKAELLQDNYFHAVLEATKSVGEKIRQFSGSTEDGSDLVDYAFGLGTTGIPRVAFSALVTASHRSEHTGLMNLMKGLFGTFRNPTAHAPKIEWPILKPDALDILSLASLLHRRLDGAVRTPRP